MVFLKYSSLCILRTTSIATNWNNQKIHRRFSSLNAHSENLDLETVPVFTMKHELKERVDSSVCQKLKFCCFFHHFWRGKGAKAKIAGHFLAASSALELHGQCYHAWQSYVVAVDWTLVMQGKHFADQKSLLQPLAAFTSCREEWRMIIAATQTH